jgi:hypothetical protein
LNFSLMASQKTDADAAGRFRRLKMANWKLSVAHFNPAARGGLAVVGLAAAWLFAGCNKGLPPGALVITQIPIVPANSPASADSLDARYPPGSRVVVVQPPKIIQVLSAGLTSAGSPVVSPDNRRIYFAGKASAEASWQIYETKSSGGKPRAVTAVPSGAMDPALSSKGELVFSSPVPRRGQMWNAPTPSALYAQRETEPPRRLTFGPKSAVAPTVLADGRILFISALTAADTNAPLHLGLFTVNNDGTEITRFALDRDGAAYVHRPREIGDGRVAFLASAAGGEMDWRAESVRLARPFHSLTPLVNVAANRCGSVEPSGRNGLLVCLESRGMARPAMQGSFGVFQVSGQAVQMLFDDPAWHEIEAVPLLPRPQPMGHISVMSAVKKTGIILCMDANFHRDRRVQTGQLPRAERVRVLAGGETGALRTLGELPLEADGSFIAEVPADTLLGFETLAADGRVVYQQPPALWVRAGENRSCVGCHEPYNRSPRNYRPLAANRPPVRLDGRAQKK